MNEIMQQKIDEFKKKKKTINTIWFERFFNMLEQVGVADDLILTAMEFAFSEEMSNSYKMGGYKNVLNRDNKTQAVNDEFFQYLSSMAQKMGYDDFRVFLEESIIEMQKDYIQHQNDQHSAKTNFINLFIRRLVIQNPQDVKLERSGTPMFDMAPDENDGRIDVIIAGVSIGHLEYNEEKSSMPLIAFTEFRTIPGLERLGLGTFMFSSFCKEVNKIKPNHSVIAWNVAKDKDGSKTYSAWGAIPIDSTYSDEDGRTIIGPMTDEQYKNSKGPFIYYFSPEVIENLSHKEVEKYSQNENHRTNDCFVK